jgi:hypothetical protein
VGASYDVIILARPLGPISEPVIRTAYMVPLILAAVIWTWKKTKAKTLHAAVTSA